MTREKLHSKMTRENMHKINVAVDDLVASLSKSTDTSDLDISMAVWSLVNFDLLFNQKMYPENNVQNVMNGITISQNEYISDNWLE